MKIIDSFLFSEAYEKELLLLKFLLEDKGIHEWVIIENAYSFQGEYIGLNARRLINEDERFKPYRHKITYIEKEQPTKVLPRYQVLDALSYKVEYWQRDLAYDYFLQHYTAEDWIMIADVDEMIDFTDAKRVQELNSHIKTSNGLLVIPTKRYWYDFDNEYRQLINNTMCSKEYLLKTGEKLHEIRRDNRKVSKEKWKHIVQFEYSTCYGTENILRKFYTSTHTGFTHNDLKQSLRCNHRPTYEVRGTRPGNNKLFFFRIVRLNAYNSPKYVRENLSSLRTNNIDVNYKQNRREDYPELFTLKYYLAQFIDDNKKKLQKKLRFALRKLKIEKYIYGSSVH